MSKQIKNLIQALIGCGIGAIFLYFTLSGKNLTEIIVNIQEARISYVIISILLLILVFFLRALRWKILLNENNIHPKTKRIFTSILLAYFVNSFTPKLGEIVRCTSLQKNKNKSIAKILGSVFAERAYDLIILALGLLSIFFLEFVKLKSLISKTIGEYSFLGQQKYLIIIPFCIIILLVYVYIKKSKNKSSNKLIIFTQKLIESLIKGFKIKKNKQFLLLTASIWICLILLNYTYLQCLTCTQDLTIGFATIILFVGGIGWALPSPGGIGTTHFFLLQLFLVYNLDAKAGISFGILSNGLTFITTIILGLMAWVYYSYNNYFNKDY